MGHRRIVQRALDHEQRVAHRPEYGMVQVTYNISPKEGQMKKIGRSLVAMAAICTLVVGMVGCKKEGAAERAGKQLDKAGDNIKDAVNDLKR